MCSQLLLPFVWKVQKSVSATAFKFDQLPFLVFASTAHGVANFSSSLRFLSAKRTAADSLGTGSYPEGLVKSVWTCTLKTLRALVRSKNPSAACLLSTSSAVTLLDDRKRYNNFIQIPRTMSVSDDLDDETGIKKFSQRFLDSAARGDVEELNTLIETVDVDVKSERGWTALMFAARNGHTSVISTLIEKGCDVNALNSSGQTAFDIAEFWNHKPAASLLSQHKQDEQFGQTHNYYSLNPLYRASNIRKDLVALQAAQRNASTKFILFANLQPFLVPSDGPKAKFKFAFFSGGQLPADLWENSKLIFLGLETWDPESSAWFAVDVGDQAVKFATELYPSGQFVTPFPVTMQMEPNHAGVFAEAHSVLCWLDRYRFCPSCGSKQKMVEGGYKQICSKAECVSHKGVHNTSYPRVDPSLIMLVVSPDRQRCLLGRQKRFPPKMYSCLAGFMEPGECIEDTCRREVEEESGVKVGRVEYHSSQPWPFPASLMLGCIAYARTDSIEVDKEELEDARWFSRSDLVLMLAHQHPDGFFVPPKQAIAHQLIKAWVKNPPSNL